MKRTFQRYLSMALCILMMLGAVPVSAMAEIDEPITGETGSGWSEVGSAPSQEEPTLPPQDSGSDERPELPPTSSEVQPDDEPSESKPEEMSLELPPTALTPQLPQGRSGD